MDKKINIIINGNSMTAVELRKMGRGYVHKTYKGKLLSSIDQTAILVNSINQNWNFHNEIFFMHSYPLLDKDRARLERLGVKILHRKSNSKHPGLAFANRGASYLEPMACTHRLILDSDMIALREPVFDFKLDVAATPGKSLFTLEQWKRIFAHCDLTIPTNSVRKETMNNNSYTQYYSKNRVRFFPYFNHGAVLIKNELAHEVGTRFIEYRDILYNVYAHYHGQIAIGLAINETTKNWGPLPRGFNFLATLEPSVRFPLKDITLYHYLGKKGGRRLQRYDRFFKGVI